MEIVWRAFELRPEPIPTLPPDGDYLQRVWNNSVYPLAERLGMTMKLPPVQPRSGLAHEAAHWARAENRFDEYNAAVFRAFFERGENIGETKVLISLARQSNMNEERLRLALENGEFLETVVFDEKEAKIVGVSGVPAFVANRRAALSGVQTAENLKQLITRAR